MISLLKHLYNLLFLKPFIKNWQIPTPNKLWLKNNKTVKPQYLSLSKIESTLRITWIENILGKSTQLKHIYSLLNQMPKPLYTITHEEHLQRTQEFSDNCLIRWLDNEVGWAVTLGPGKKLKKGFINCYTGIIKTIPSHQESFYESREYFHTILKNNHAEIVVDAKHYGNHSRLLPFLLDAKYLENFDIDPSIKNKIAVANLEFHLALLNGTITPCVFAPNDIIAPLDKELLLGINYSLPYLFKMQQANKLFKFLDKETFKQLDPNLYPLKQIEVKLLGIEYSFHLPRLRIMIAEQFPQLKHRTVGFDETTQQYFEILVSDSDIYKALMENPLSNTLTVRPIINKIT